MRKILNIAVLICFVGLAGCAANLVVENTLIDHSAQTVAVSEKNIENKDVGKQLAYIVMNEAGVVASAESQPQLF